MILRYKWYDVRLPVEVKEFFQKLKGSPYTLNAPSGFIVDGSSMSFRYVWQSTINTTSFDNEGNEEYQAITTTNSQDIKVIKGERIIFRAENPSRSMREPLNAIEKIVGFGFSCEPINLRDEHIQEALSTIENKKLNSLKVSGAIQEAKALARIELASKEGLQADKIEILSTGNFTIDAATYDVSYKGVRGQIGFSKAGLCKLSGQLSELLLSNIENVIIRRNR